MPPSILSFPANNAEGVDDDSMDSGEHSSGEGVGAKEKGVEECVRDSIERVENARRNVGWRHAANRRFTIAVLSQIYAFSRLTIITDDLSKSIVFFGVSSKASWKEPIPPFDELNEWFIDSDKYKFISYTVLCMLLQVGLYFTFLWHVYYEMDNGFGRLLLFSDGSSIKNFNNQRMQAIKYIL